MVSSCEVSTGSEERGREDLAASLEDGQIRRARERSPALAPSLLEASAVVNARKALPGCVVRRGITEGPTRGNGNGQAASSRRLRRRTPGSRPAAADTRPEPVRAAVPGLPIAQGVVLAGFDFEDAARRIADRIHGGHEGGSVGGDGGADVQVHRPPTGQTSSPSRLDGPGHAQPWETLPVVRTRRLPRSRIAPSILPQSATPISGLCVEHSVADKRSHTRRGFDAALPGKNPPMRLDTDAGGSVDSWQGPDRLFVLSIQRRTRG